MSEAASLELKVTSSGFVDANTQMRELATGAAKTERATESLAESFKKMVGPIAASVTVYSAFKKLVDTTREFDKLNAGLITATGSAEGAEKAFAALQEFAATTPYSLRETTDSFVKLVNYGLQPSERALRSYGNTASALGKDIGQMVEAVADAQTGEFERLKEFGIKASQQGDKVKFVFRGVATEVAKNAQEIQNYLIKLGETNFGDSMENRMKTLDGAISNLGDSWDKLFLTIGRGQVGELIKDAVKTATDALESFSKSLNSSSFIEGVKEFKQAVVGVASTIDELAVRATAYAKIAWSASGSGNPFAGFAERAKGIKSAREELDRELERIKYATQSAMRDFDMDAAKAKAAATKQEQESKDRLAAYEKSGGKASFGTKSAAKGPQFNLMDTMAQLDQQERRERAERYQQQYDAIKAALAREEDSERKSYEDRKKFLDNYFGKDQEELWARNEELWGKHLDELAEKEAKSAKEKRKALESMTPESTNPFAQLAREEASKLELLEETRLTDLRNSEAYEAAKFAVRQEYARKSHDMEMELMLQSTQNAEALFGSLGTAAENWGGKQSASYKAMFAAQKAFAMASATTSMAVGIGKAMELGWPAGIPAAISAAAEGAKILAIISSTNYSGAYDAGGYIPGGKVGLVGERGPEFVRGPAMVTGREETARMRSSGGSERPQISITVVNSPDGRANSYRAASAREHVVVSDTRRAKGAMQRALT